jgi:hypothetical protein
MSSFIAHLENKQFSHLNTDEDDGKPMWIMEFDDVAAGELIDEYIMGLSKKFMKYRLNIFLLNRVIIILVHIDRLL